MSGAFTAATTLETMAAPFDPACCLDVAGFNSAPLFTAIGSLACSARVIANLLVFQDASVDSTHIKNNFECVKILTADNAAIQGDPDYVKSDLVTVTSELRAVPDKAHQVHE